MMNSRGSTLVELLIAITIMVVAISGFVSLSLRNSHDQRQSTSRLIANQLAVEGLEVVRNLRDSQWLINQTLSDVVGDGEGLVRFDRDNQSWSFDDSADSLDQARLYLTNDLYDHEVTADGPSPYSRLIYIDAICADDIFPSPDIDWQNLGGRTCQAGQQIGWRIVSWVSWLDNGQTFDWQLVDYLYDWR